MLGARKPMANKKPQVGTYASKLNPQTIVDFYGF